MEDVAKACCDFLTKHLEPANVIGISRFAEEIGCTELHKTCRKYINSHFSEVRGTDLWVTSNISIKALLTTLLYVPTIWL